MLVTSGSPEQSLGLVKNATGEIGSPSCTAGSPKNVTTAPCKAEQLGGWDAGYAHTHMRGGFRCPRRSRT